MVIGRTGAGFLVKCRKLKYVSFLFFQNHTKKQEIIFLKAQTQRNKGNIRGERRRNK